MKLWLNKQDSRAYAGAWLGNVQHNGQGTADLEKVVNPPQAENSDFYNVLKIA